MPELQAVDTQPLTPERHRELFRRMLLIRRVEERIAERGIAGDFPGHYHVYIGQEATGVAITALMESGDTLVTTHRNHGHVLAKGGEPGRAFAEILGRDAGYCHGKAGSIHVSAVELGVISASGIVAGSIPTATGAALAYKYGNSFPDLKVHFPSARRPRPAGDAPALQGRLAVAFFGDGALNEGAWHESAVIATWWKLPIIYVCENNDSVPYDPRKAKMSGTTLATHAAAYGMMADSVDGTDLEAVWTQFQVAAAHARAGGGPFFLESRTVAWPGNRTTFPSLPLGLTDLQHAWEPPAEREFATWYAHDPVLKQARRLVDAEWLTREEVDAIDIDCRAIAAEADRWAHEQPYPPDERAFEHVFSVPILEDRPEGPSQ